MREDKFPDRESWQHLLEFFQNHKPLSQEVGCTLWFSLEACSFTQTQLDQQKKNGNKPEKERER